MLEKYLVKRTVYTKFQISVVKYNLKMNLYMSLYFTPEGRIYDTNLFKKILLRDRTAAWRNGIVGPNPPWVTNKVGPCGVFRGPAANGSSFVFLGDLISRNSRCSCKMHDGTLRVCLIPGDYNNQII